VKHYCCREHENAEKQCDLCVRQERKLLNDQKIRRGEPTLTHNPFAKLLEKRNG
jgi:hypothetical protein